MIDISKPLRITIDGTGKFTLTPQDHVRTGGEGHVYRKDHRAIKVWDDPARAATDRMVERLPGLIALVHPSIAAPTALVKDNKDVVIGYAMPWVNGWDLPLAFTNDWRRVHQFGTDDAVGFTSILREVLIFVHDRGFRMGDPNELNILGLKERPVYIDVDSWLPPGFAATTRPTKSSAYC